MRQHKQQIEIAVCREQGTEDLPLPAYATAGSAGMDLVAALPADEPLTLLPGERALVPTGLAIAIPPGFEAQVRPRSGLACKHGVTLVNAPGTIDSDFRGLIQVLLINLGQAPVTFARGDRIAQLVVSPVVQAAWKPVITLPATERGGGGFGSTGTGA